MGRLKLLVSSPTHSTWTPVGLVGFDIVTPREKFYQHDSGKEPSDVRPECDATALSPNGLQNTEELKKLGEELGVKDSEGGNQ